jgi:gamma-glutamyl-gamma-aminobutyrate hydrolase PuuD
MFGICRGAQLLHALNGGELWQHVQGHNGPDHVIYDIDEDVYVTATSYHHQMLALNDKIEVIAVTKEQLGRTFMSDNMSITIGEQEVELEIEAGSYAKTKCFFVQGHPEVGSVEYKSWTMWKLNELLLAWKDDEDEIIEEPTAAQTASVAEEMIAWQAASQAV